MVQAGEKPIVTITGVTGYVGCVVAQEFLKDGSYTVRGTVRSKTNEAKIGPLRDGLGELFNQLEPSIHMFNQSELSVKFFDQSDISIYNFDQSQLVSPNLVASLRCLELVLAFTVQTLLTGHLPDLVSILGR